MKIRKQIKRERTRRKNIITFSLLVMALIPYLIIVLNDQSIFKGWEAYFSFSFVGAVDLLILLNVIRVISDSFFEFTVNRQRIRIKESIIRKPVIIHAEKIAYVDVAEKAKGDFDILVIMEKGKRHRSFESLDENFIKSHIQYKDVYEEFLEQHKGNDYYTYIIRKAGAKKYYYLYLIYKNAYNAKFTKNAVNLIKRFMEEYNLA